MSAAPPTVFPPTPPLPERPELPEGVEPKGEAPAWRPWTAPVAMLSAFAFAIFGFILLGGVSEAAGYDYDSPGVTIGATMMQDVALIGAALWFARVGGNPKPRPWQFGLRKTRFWPALGWMLLAWLTFFILSAIYAAILSVDEEDDLPDDLGADESTLALIAVAFLVTVMAPVIEEFFFRGYFFTAMRNWKGPWVASIITGVVFGLIHAGSAPPEFLVPLSLLGILLCLLVWRTRSIYPAIVLHCGNNSIAFGVSQDWGWEIPVLFVGALTVITVMLWPFRNSDPKTDPVRV